MTLTFGTRAELSLDFAVLDTPVAAAWLERMSRRHAWPLDHPDRFYGFGTAAQEQERAVAMVEGCIDIINQHRRIIDKPFEFTQDCFNYLHAIFERYHGLLDQQNSPFWLAAPPAVRTALAELNLAVHRCESVMAGSAPRLVCTWFGMPKELCLGHNMQRQYGTNKIEFGTVYLNYCEIGKTVEDLAHDNDKYISEAAFRPFGYYSADFNIAFYDRNLQYLYPKIQKYIDTHQDFFGPRGIHSVYHIQAQPLRFPVARLECDLTRSKLLNLLAQHQWIYSVKLT